MFPTKLKKKAHKYYIRLIFPPKVTLYEVLMCINVLQPNRPHMTVKRMRLACWITKAADTDSEYVTHIAFPLQKWLHAAPQCCVIRKLPVLCYCDVT